MSGSVPLHPLEAHHGPEDRSNETLLAWSSLDLSGEPVQGACRGWRSLVLASGDAILRPRSRAIASNAFAEADKVKPECLDDERNLPIAKCIPRPSRRSDRQRLKNVAITVTAKESEPGTCVHRVRYPCVMAYAGSDRSRSSNYNLPSMPTSTVAQLGLAPAAVISAMHWWSRRTDHSHSWGLTQLGKMTGLRRTTLIRAIAKLEGDGWIQVKREGGVRNTYTILDHAVDLFFHKETGTKPLCQVCQSIREVARNDTSSVPDRTIHQSENTPPGVPKRTTLSSSSERASEVSPSSPPPTPGSQTSSVEEKKKAAAAFVHPDWCDCGSGDQSKLGDSRYTVCVVDGCNRALNLSDAAALRGLCLPCDLENHQVKMKLVTEDKKKLKRNSTNRCSAQGCRYFEETPGDDFCRKHLRDLRVTE